MGCALPSVLLNNPNGVPKGFRMDGCTQVLIKLKKEVCSYCGEASFWVYATEGWDINIILGINALSVSEMVRVRPLFPSHSSI